MLEKKISFPGGGNCPLSMYGPGTELWRIDLHKTYLNRYDRKWIEIVIGLDALWDWIDIVCKCPFIHQNLNLRHVLQAAIWP